LERSYFEIIREVLQRIEADDNEIAALHNEVNNEIAALDNEVVKPQQQLQNKGDLIEEHNASVRQQLKAKDFEVSTLNDKIAELQQQIQAETKLSTQQKVSSEEQLKAKDSELANMQVKVTNLEQQLHNKATFTDELHTVKEHILHGIVTAAATGVSREHLDAKLDPLNKALDNLTKIVEEAFKEHAAQTYAVLEKHTDVFKPILASLNEHPSLASIKDAVEEAHKDLKQCIEATDPSKPGFRARVKETAKKVISKYQGGKEEK
jgi:hypothetical protein